MKRGLFCSVWMMAGLALAQEPQRLTLADAEQIALRQHPRIAAAALNAQAAGAVISQTKSAMMPLLSGNVTSAGAQTGSAVGAGTITTSALDSRAASGLVASQLITDFGRTGQLTRTSELRASAQNQVTAATRTQVLLAVEQAYFQTLAAEAVRQVATATIEARRLVLRQVRAAAESALKSSLDVSFAEVSVSESELALTQAENDVQLRHARLSSAMGYEQDQPFTLAEEPLPAPLTDSLETLIARARQDRPDLAGLQLTQQAAARFADAEKRLKYPSISMLGVAGGIPLRDERLHSSYGAIGVNISVPILNGGLFKARQAEADYRAAAAAKDAQSLSLSVAQDVQTSYWEARTASQRMDLTRKLVEQAGRALHLAQARYDLGLSSIVELTQAQLAQTTAQIQAAQAKYDYLTRRAALEYATGARR